MNAVTAQLVAKELHAYRWLIVGAIAAGVFALALASVGEMAFNIGALLWLTTIVACGVIMPMYGIHRERKEGSLLFALSLPISPAGYARAKMLGMLASFGSIWAVLCIGAIVMVAAVSRMPNGLLPYLLLLSGFLLANFTVVMCGAFLAKSEVGVSLVIILTNMGVTVFMLFVGRMPAISTHMLASAPVWSGAFFMILAAEIATLAIALTVPPIVISRRREIV